MDPNEPRTIWICLDPAGTPREFSWAVRKGLSGDAAYPGKSASWHAALMRPGEQPADGWDAIPTQWRRVPPMLQPALFGAGGEDPQLRGNVLSFAGMEWDLTESGRVHPQHSARSPRNPSCPDVTLVDGGRAVAMLVAADAANRAAAIAEVEAKASARGLTTEERVSAVAQTKLSIRPAQVNLVEAGSLRQVVVSADPARARRVDEDVLLKPDAGLTGHVRDEAA